MAIEDNNDELLNHLIANGAIKLSGYSDNGEPRYEMTDVAKELYPEVYNAFMFDVGNFIFKMWSLDMIDVKFEEDNVFVKLNENSLNEEKIMELDPQDREEFLNIIDAYTSKYFDDIISEGD